jgi:hypothetical protein
VDDVGLNRQILLKELGRKIQVGHDAPYSCGTKEDILGLFFFEKAADLIFGGKVELRVSSNQDIPILFPL